MIGDDAPDADWVAPPLLEVHVAVNAVMASPASPFAVNATIAELLPRVTPVMVGAGGAVAATNDAEAVDAAPFPNALVATTVQVYVLAVGQGGDRQRRRRTGRGPRRSTVARRTRRGVAGDRAPTAPFAVNVTIAVLLPCVTPVSVGASGRSPATNDDDATDAALSPNPLVATTVQVYVLPLVSELTVIGDDAPDRTGSCHRRSTCTSPCNR